MRFHVEHTDSDSTKEEATEDDLGSVGRQCDVKILAPRLLGRQPLAAEVPGYFHLRRSTAPTSLQPCPDARSEELKTPG